MNKKGSVRDVILIGVLVFAVAIGLFVINFMMGQTVSKITTNPSINSSAASLSAFQSITTKITPKFDYLVFAFFIGLVLALVITGYFIGGNPIFMFIYFIGIVLAVVLSAVLSNVWEQVISSPTFGTTISSFPITNHLMSYLPIYMAVVGFIGIVVMFAKPQGESMGGFA